MERSRVDCASTKGEGAAVKGNLILLAGSMMVIIQVCQASTPEAWEEFGDDVRAASEVLVEDIILKPEIYVDPFGSESYGMAVIHGFDRSTLAEVVYIAVYDKATGGIEISGEILPSELRWLRDLLDENLRLRRTLEALGGDSR